MKALPVILALIIILVALTSCQSINYVPKPDDSWLWRTI